MKGPNVVERIQIMLRIVIYILIALYLEVFWLPPGIRAAEEIPVGLVYQGHDESEAQHHITI